MFKIECECGASNVIEAAEHLDSGNVTISLDRSGKIEVFCCECSEQIKSE
ncbi:hypothetical protein [Paenibacillus senegalimassiliensis]|nr:hypothetical protein [Paenibacillus senegalimassiliensis]